MQPMDADQIEEFLAMQRRQTLRLDQMRVMLGVLVGLTVLSVCFFLAALSY